jgi:hypothetical protein
MQAAISTVAQRLERMVKTLPMSGSMAAFAIWKSMMHPALGAVFTSGQRGAFSAIYRISAVQLPPPCSDRRGDICRCACQMEHRYRERRRGSVHVPRCFAAVNECTGEIGALVEFFFGYPSDEPGLRFIHGSDVAQAVITDKKKGRPHSIRYNVRACRAYGIMTPEIWWGSVLAFDAPLKLSREDVG